VTGCRPAAALFEAHAVVSDPGQDAIVHSRHCTFDAAGPGMLADVGQRLLRDAVGDDLRLGRRAVLQRGLQLDVDGVLPFHHVQVLAQRRGKPALIERRRPQLEEQVAEPIRGCLDALLQKV
jgi:hypothetical protein